MVGREISSVGKDSEQLELSLSCYKQEYKLI